MLLSIVSSNSSVARSSSVSETLQVAKDRTALEIGRRIVEAREDAGLSQAALAREIRVSRGAVAQWEGGGTQPTAGNLREVALTTKHSVEWLATGRGPQKPLKNLGDRYVRQVPLVSWVSAGELRDAETQISVEDAPTVEYLGTEPGEFFALRVQGDSMDRRSPPGSIIVVNRRDRTLIPGKGYVFCCYGETTYKLWRANPDYLEPDSYNPMHRPLFIKRKKDLYVVGRVVRTIIDHV